MVRVRVRVRLRVRVRVWVRVRVNVRTRARVTFTVRIPGWDNMKVTHVSSNMFSERFEGEGETSGRRG